MFWMLFQPPVTVGRLTIACVIAGKFAFRAASNWVWLTFSDFSRNASSAGCSAVTDDSGIVWSSAVVCGKFFCSAATTAACESPVFCDTNAISFGTSAAAPPSGVTSGSAMSTFVEMKSMPARAPVTRSCANAGLAASSTFCPSLRRGIRFRPSTTVTTRTPTTSTTTHWSSPDRLALLPCTNDPLLTLLVPAGAS